MGGFVGRAGLVKRGAYFFNITNEGGAIIFSTFVRLHFTKDSLGLASQEQCNNHHHQRHLPFLRLVT